MPGNDNNYNFDPNMERKCMIQGVGKHIKYEGQIHMPHMPVNNIQTN